VFESRLPGFEGATGWINSKPLVTDDLRRKVVLVDFWTYTCINWIRTLPYIRSWAGTYGPHGLVVIGVHTPEFQVEHEVEGVRRAAREMRVDYPIAIDNEYAVWNAFANQYWPALYIADSKGRIRHHHFGEGGYEKSEQVIRDLLTDAWGNELPEALAAVSTDGIEAPADWNNVGSPETYLGLARSDSFASAGGAFSDVAQPYAVPDQLLVNEWALDGIWTIGREEALLIEPNGRIALRFHARDVNLILVPPGKGSSARFRVSLDGQPPNASHGLDVDDDGNGLVREPKLYQLIRQPGHISDRRFEIEFYDAGTSALCFTFG
jgi:thiol-disulfide isomerase/thioredoxin